MKYVSAADYAEISHLIATITHANDRQDAAAWLACWSSDPRAHIETVGIRTRELVGRDALQESTLAWADRDPGQVHQAGLVAVTDDGEGWAKATHSAILVRMSISGPRFTAFAHYHDHVILEGGSWRMHDRRVRVWYTAADS